MRKQVNRPIEDNYIETQRLIQEHMFDLPGLIDLSIMHKRVMFYDREFMQCARGIYCDNYSSQRCQYVGLRARCGARHVKRYLYESERILAYRDMTHQSIEWSYTLSDLDRWHVRSLERAFERLPVDMSA